MRNVYCLSGILITRKGKVLLFSWMNNQFPDNSSDVRKAMEIFLNHIREHY
jgi:D-alanyl-D-alanine carboxypeptidase/D-alanyl-D-alanine-endopeptidase (penicillin-binding protein 4)